MRKRAIDKINKNHLLLVFPVKNQKEPKSLWSELYPKQKMRWEWDDEGDNRVARMWYLMKRLSSCREVVYSKWYQGRATFFSRSLFVAMLCVVMRSSTRRLSPTAEEILSLLESDSPCSTKEIKKITGLVGRFNAGQYNRAMKELFLRQLIVGFGEVDDGAFPSLAVGATKTLYEDLWTQAETMDPFAAQRQIDLYLPPRSLVRKFFSRVVSLNNPE